MLLLTFKQKIEIIEISTGNSARQTAAIFNQRHPEQLKPLDQRTVSRLKKKFHQFGSFERKKRREVPSLMKSITFQDVLKENLRENRHASLNELAEHVGKSRSSVHRTLKGMKYHSYKMSVHQQQLGLDHQSPQRFCVEFIEKIEADPTFPQIVLFSDESIFRAKGTFNRQTFRLI